MEPAVYRCWCGAVGEYAAMHERQSGECDGDGHVDCLCGGDLCVCHNHGEIECFGCRACRWGDDDDGWGYQG